MHTRSNRKNIKIIVGIIAAVIVLMAAVVTIIIFTYLRKPQVKLVEAMVKTVNSVQESDMNQRYGMDKLVKKMLQGSVNCTFENTGKNDKTVHLEIKRSADDHRFYAETAIDDKSFKLFVNEKTSLIYLNDNAIRIPYSDDIITEMSNSPITKILNLDNETVYAFGNAYGNFMRMAANNYSSDEEMDTDTDVLEKTVKYFMDMKGKYEGYQKFEVGEREEKCKVYSVVFDVNDFYDYLDDCFGTHELDFQNIYDAFSKYMPYIETIDNIAVMVHDIKQFVDGILNQKNITIYFAINRDGELVTLYADNVSEKNASFELRFNGRKYIAQKFEMSIKIGGDSPMSLVISKKDIDRDNMTGVSYDIEIISSGIIKTAGAGLDVFFSDDNAQIDLRAGDSVISKKVLVAGNKDGVSLDLKWNENSAGSLHIGCDPGKIRKPDYSQCMDLFDTDIISMYKFMKSIVSGDK